MGDGKRGRRMKQFRDKENFDDWEKIGTFSI